MSNIAHARISIKGKRPYFFHNFTRDAIPLGREVKTGKAGNDPEEWRRTVCVMEDGKLYAKASQVFAMIRDGAKFTKKGRGSIQKDVIATLLVESPEEIPFDRSMPDDLTENKNEPVYLDVRGVRNPSTRGRNIRYRVAMSPGWLLEFEVSWDQTIVGVNTMEAILIDAGRMVGIGNGRSIGMGRFAIESFGVLATAV